MVIFRHNMYLEWLILRMFRINIRVLVPVRWHRYEYHLPWM
jgi:hypothetical protein